MARRRSGAEGEGDEPDLTEVIERPFGAELTPVGADPRIVEDASAELGPVEPTDPPTDQAPDITPDQLESRSPASEEQETVRPAAAPRFIHEGD